MVDFKILALALVVLVSGTAAAWYSGYNTYQTFPPAYGYGYGYNYNTGNQYQAPYNNCFNIPYSVGCSNSYSFYNAQPSYASNFYSGSSYNYNTYGYAYAPAYPIYYNNPYGGNSAYLSGRPPSWVNGPNYWYYG